MEELDGGVEHTAPVWAVFGDLMSGLLGAFVLMLVGLVLRSAWAIWTALQGKGLEAELHLQ